MDKQIFAAVSCLVVREMAARQFHIESEFAVHRPAMLAGNIVTDNAVRHGSKIIIAEHQSAAVVYSRVVAYCASGRRWSAVSDEKSAALQVG